MKKFIIILNLIVSTLLLLTANAKDSTYNKLISENSYINPSEIIKISDGTYSLIIKAYNKGQYEPINGSFISYTLTEHVINCTSSTYKLGIINSYDEDDDFVNGDYNKYATFQPIVPGTTDGDVYNFICKP
jgi:hypothetical protein